MRKSLYDYCLERGETALLEEWDGERNGVTPEEVSYGSKRKYWWRCARGHSYQASATSRTCEQTGCPYCSGRFAIPGENDLQTVRPDIARMWDMEKNAPLTPRDVLPGSHRVVWWRCENGHSWRAAVKVRTGGSGCPVCANRELTPGVNDLATSRPQLAAEWDTEKNLPLTPSDVFPGSNRRVWWRCAAGHEWRARIASRSDGAGCPYCAGKLVKAGDNDLATAFPKLAAEWDTERNAPLTPEDVTPYSNRRVWWRCSEGHEYQAVIAARSTSGSGCPYCTGRRALPGFNDLASQEPKVAAQWAQDLNGSLTPEMVTTGSHKKVWWRCSEGHVWRAVIFTRARGSFCGCPVCAGKTRRRHTETYTRARYPGTDTIDKEESRV